MDNAKADESLAGPGNTSQQDESSRTGRLGLVDDPGHFSDGRIGHRARAFDTSKRPAREELPGGLHDGGKRTVGVGMEKSLRLDDVSRPRRLRSGMW